MATYTAGPQTVRVPINAGQQYVFFNNSSAQFLTGGQNPGPSPIQQLTIEPGVDYLVENPQAGTTQYVLYKLVNGVVTGSVVQLATPTVAPTPPQQTAAFTPRPTFAQTLRNVLLPRRSFVNASRVAYPRDNTGRFDLSPVAADRDVFIGRSTTPGGYFYSGPNANSPRVIGMGYTPR